MVYEFKITIYSQQDIPDAKITEVHWAICECCTQLENLIKGDRSISYERVG